MRIFASPKGIIFVYRREFTLQLGNIGGYRELTPNQKILFKQFLQNYGADYIELPHNLPVEVTAVSGQVAYLLVVFSRGTRLRVSSPYKWSPD